jgi:RNA polymerase sigma factor (TIGR02999 family)
LAKLDDEPCNEIQKYLLYGFRRSFPLGSDGSMGEAPGQSEELGWSNSIYDQLHRVAEKALAREKPGHSLQPTLLVNDAWLKLVDQENVDAADRAQVMAAGANIIRRLLVDHARKRKSQKRGGADGRGLPLHISIADSAGQIELLELNDALETLERDNPRAAQVVEMKFFGGLSGVEIAQQLEVSLRTVNNDWRFAKAWLYRVLSADPKSQNNDT